MFLTGSRGFAIPERTAAGRLTVSTGIPPAAGFFD